mmetsp:Transcript_120057/g.346820  ORF Transcript_120057/g.346820 Transcript_120057/m.346820 type:complete len:219 (-) Transcript_120057:55-711(-)
MQRRRAIAIAQRDVCASLEEQPGDGKAIPQRRVHQRREAQRIRAVGRNAGIEAEAHVVEVAIGRRGADLLRQLLAVGAQVREALASRLRRREQCTGALHLSGDGLGLVAVASAVSLTSSNLQVRQVVLQLLQGGLRPATLEVSKATHVERLVKRRQHQRRRPVTPLLLADIGGFCGGQGGAQHRRLDRRSCIQTRRHGCCKIDRRRGDRNCRSCDLGL